MQAKSDSDMTGVANQQKSEIIGMYLSMLAFSVEARWTIPTMGSL